MQQRYERRGYGPRHRRHRHRYRWPRDLSASCTTHTNTGKERLYYFWRLEYCHAGAHTGRQARKQESTVTMS